MASKNSGAKIAITICWLQGLYYAVLGLWPLFSIRTFEAVTGNKTDNLPTGLEADHWLVYTVGALITAVGLVLLMAAWRRHVSAEIAFLGAASAISLGAIDVIYVLRQVISSIYLIDFALELLFVLAWAASAFCHLGQKRN